MSGAYVPYHQRQNKAVDRQLFIDLLQRVNRRVPITDAVYVGFGGAFLEDFKLAHTTFDIKKMISLEINEAAFARQRFNLPLGCITCLHMASGEFVSEYRNLIDKHAPRAKSAIIWLDYASAGVEALREQIQEFQSLISKMAKGDVLKITVNAAPRALLENEFDTDGKRHTAEKMRELRAAVLYSKLGSDYLGTSVDGDAVTITNYPKTLAFALQRAAMKAVRGRDVIFQPLGTFVYADSEHRMLTLTGVILGKGEEKGFLNDIRHKSLRLASANWGDVTEIRLPALTAKEKLFIDRHLPRSSAKTIHRKLGFKFDQKSTESEKILQNYVKFYRQYPNFQRTFF
ncbi:MAG: O-methyltransferase [Limisphaerales bacterium]